jgi:biopolymer transport protein ExbD
MAQIAVQPTEANKKNRVLRPALKVDMTPMVDLGFLLITFFILTTTMAENKMAPLVVPADGPPGTAPESATMSVLLGKDNKAYVYYGRWEDAVKEKKIFATGYHVHSGLGNFVRARQKWLEQFRKPQGKNSLIYLIKPSDNATYQNVVDALDEATINSVKRYAIVPINKEESDYIAVN